MLAYTYIEKGCFELLDKPKPEAAKRIRRHCESDAFQYLHQ